MYLEEKIDFLIAEQKRLVEMVELFLPNLETEKGVIHFLEITKETLNSYLKKEILKQGVHYVEDRKNHNRRVYIPDAIVKLKKIGVKGKHKISKKEEAILEAVNTKLGIISECRHVV